MKKPKKLTAKQFDKLFDDGGDILPHLDLKSARLVKPAIRRMNVDLPAWALSALNNAATRRGIPRQALVKSWLVECLEREGDKLVKKAA